MLQTVLLITIVGMGLVFIAILLLWGMMELLVRITNGKARNTVERAEDAALVETTSNPGKRAEQSAVNHRKAAAAAVAAAIHLRRRQAAVLAVRTALASQGETPGEQPASVQHSNWQPVLRSARMQDRLRLFTRKPRRSS